MAKVIKVAEISKLVTKMPANKKQGEVLAGDWPTRHTVATMVIDNICPPAEVHEKAFDVWLVLGGQGKFILGGELEQSQMISDGEYTGKTIIGGEEFMVGPGDIIDIPPGVPHQIDARGGRLETVIIKIRD